MSYGSVYEAMERKGLDFQVKCAPMITASGTPCDRNKAVCMIRDNLEVEVLGVVGNRYKPLQPRQTIGWLDQLVSEVGGEVADMGRNKSTIWARITLPFQQVVRTRQVGDLIGKELFVFDSFDGTSRAIYEFRNIRLVCLNGMTSTVGGAR